MGFKRKVSIITIVFILTTLFTFITKEAKADDTTGVLRTIYCSTAKEIQDAMQNAIPGDRIIIKEGSYTGAWTTGGYYYSNKSGTKENPIIIESENPNNKSELLGLRPESGYVLYLIGSYWKVNNLKIASGQKGVMIDKGQYNILDGCEVYNIQHEGIHLRDGSSNNLIINTKVYNTGVGRADIGEGIYVGSDKGKWNEMVKECDNNVIRNCTVGPNVRAEHFDIKEGTTGTIIEDCTLYGTGIAGQNYADSFMDIKGNKSIIRNNIGYREGNTIILDGFQIHQQVEGWGLDNEFYDNEVYLEDSKGYILDTTKGTAKVFNNRRYPEGNTYTGNYTLLDLALEDIDRNGKVDILDLSTTALAYNKAQGDFEFKKILDINKDTIIDIFDLTRISKLIN